MVVDEFWDELGRYSRTRVDSQLPPWIAPGMAGVRLDPRGKLRWFRAVPPARRPADPSRSQGAKLPLPRSVEPAEAADPSDLPWSTWFREEELGFSLEASSEKGRNPRRLSGDELREADWLRTPPDAYDHLAAWKGTWPDSDGAAVCRGGGLSRSTGLLRDPSAELRGSERGIRRAWTGAQPDLCEFWQSFWIFPSSSANCSWPGGT